MQLGNERATDASPAYLRSNADARDGTYRDLGSTEKTSRLEQKCMTVGFARVLGDDQILQATANVVGEVGAAFGEVAWVGKCARVNRDESFEIARTSRTKGHGALRP